jgi:hypothetical protein
VGFAFHPGNPVHPVKSRRAKEQDRINKMDAGYGLILHFIPSILFILSSQEMQKSGTGLTR